MRGRGKKEGRAGRLEAGPAGRKGGREGEKKILLFFFQINFSNPFSKGF
jgi:hypothetical protein